jgi:hypothetical protein
VPAFPVPRNQAPGGAWYLPWHKLGVWTLTDYDVVVYMDADVLALQNLAELATLLDGGGPPAAQWAATGCGGRGRGGCGLGAGGGWWWWRRRRRRRARPWLLTAARADTRA